MDKSELRIVVLSIKSNSQYAKKIEDTFNKAGIDTTSMYVDEFYYLDNKDFAKNTINITLQTDKITLYPKQNLVFVDNTIMYHKMSAPIIEYFKSKGVALINGYDCNHIMSSKYNLHIYLKRNQIPTPDGYIITEDNLASMIPYITKEFNFPVVIKANKGVDKPIYIAKDEAEMMSQLRASSYAKGSVFIQEYKEHDQVVRALYFRDMPLNAIATKSVNGKVSFDKATTYKLSEDQSTVLNYVVNSISGELVTVDFIVKDDNMYIIDVDFKFSIFGDNNFFTAQNLNGIINKILLDFKIDSGTSPIDKLQTESDHLDGDGIYDYLIK